MEQPSDKRLVVLNILSGQFQPDSPVIERSVLSAMASKPRPDLRDPSQVWFAGVPILFIYVGACMILHESIATPTAMALAILGFVLLTSCVWYFARKCDDALRQEARILQEPLKELNELLATINAYLENLDRRTSKYFHVVTNSKVTSYFVLTQISQTLKARIDEVAALLASPRRENLLISHQLLQGTLVFSDSFNGGAGNMHVVPLARLKTTVLQIFEFLDSELKILEEELQHRGEMPPADPAEDFGEPN